VPSTVRTKLAVLSSSRPLKSAVTPRKLDKVAENEKSAGSPKDEKEVISVLELEALAVWSNPPSRFTSPETLPAKPMSTALGTEPELAALA
jgi:hypothetical protein